MSVTSPGLFPVAPPALKSCTDSAATIQTKNAQTVLTRLMLDCHPTRNIGRLREGNRELKLALATVSNPRIP